jgi:hypothetical protein
MLSRQTSLKSALAMMFLASKPGNNKKHGYRTGQHGLGERQGAIADKLTGADILSIVASVREYREA